ncbi:putative membrane protein [Escherichia coli 3-105-05_S4_C1]|nr:putative membrane protein [Escherichia coli 3-105-05_S4_C1]
MFLYGQDFHFARALPQLLILRVIMLIVMLMETLLFLHH